MQFSLMQFYNFFSLEIQAIFISLILLDKLTNLIKLNVEERIFNI